jgi:hypothetical protein
MSESKTIPAVLEPMLRPRRLGRIHGTVASIRAEGAKFDAVIWSVFALVVVGTLLVALHLADTAWLAQHDISADWLIAGSVLVAIAVAAVLWWRWFKWRVHATILAETEASSAEL